MALISREALHSREYSVSEFFEYMKPANLAYSEMRYLESWSCWVFWDQEKVESVDRTHVYPPPISKRIKDLLHKLLLRGDSFELIQFWAPKMSGDRRLLTTCGHPFAVRRLSKMRCSYRKQCTSQDIYISGEGVEKEEGKEQLGPVGRAFLNRLPESTPNVKYYSLQEFPLRDHARLANLSSITAFPVFEVHDLKNCVGVLELADFWFDHLDTYEQALGEVGLTFKPRQFRPDPKVQQDLWEEIKHVFKVVADTHPLALALAFIPSRSCGKDECCHNCSDLGLLRLAVVRGTLESYPLNKFIRAHVAFHLQEGKGVAGKALTSRKSYFCRNICDFRITEYPLVHYARDAGLNLSFAICLQTSQSENHHLILEFFLLPGNYSYNYTHSLLESVLTKVKQHLQSYKIATEDLPGEEIFPKLINSFEDDEIDHFPVTQNSKHPPGFQILQYDWQMEQLDSTYELAMLDGDALKELDYPEAGNLTYSLSEFLEYVKPAKLTYLPSRLEEYHSEAEEEQYEYDFEEEEQYGYYSEEDEQYEYDSDDEEQYDLVFWSQENDESQALESLDGTPFDNSISGRIKRVLHHLYNQEFTYPLTQFWSPIRRGGRCFLTTSNQPFALADLSKNYCSYRKHCMNLNIYTFEEGDEEGKRKEQLVPVGRAFCNRQPELSPNLQFYSLKEFPQRDLALLCGISGLIALPVFEACGQICVGVLEFLGFQDVTETHLLAALAKALSEVGLKSNYCYSQPDSEGYQDSWKEIEQLFRVVAQTYPLASALAFVPLSSCGNDEYCHNSSDLGLWKLALFESNLYEHPLIRAHENFYVQNGKGVSGKAFAFQKPCFCKNISDLSIADYPFVHYAREVGLTLSFAIFLQTSQDDNDPLVLEFFLLPGNDSNEYTRSLMGSLLTMVSQHLQSFRIASEDVPVEEVFLKVITSLNDNEVDSLRFIQNSGYLPGRQMLQGNKEMELLDIADQHVMLEDDTTSSGRHVASEEENDVPVTHTKKKVKTKKSKRQGKGMKLDIRYDDIRQYFGKPLKDVAKSLGVSRSTIKRICRKYGIIKWPFHKKNKGNFSLFEMKNTSATPQGGERSTSVSGRNPPCPSLSVQENIDTIGQVTSHSAMTRDARTVTIKASYGELTMIKFILNFTSKLAELEEEVARRLKLKVGSFSMKYRDEDNDLISITCDTDLQLCMETMTLSGKSTIKMLVLLNSN